MTPQQIKELRAEQLQAQLDRSKEIINMYAKIAMYKQLDKDSNRIIKSLDSQLELLGELKND